MNNLATIIKEGQKVLTTQQLAEVYETDVKNISNNFNRNNGRFILGKHYFKLEGKELKEFKGIHQNDESLKYVSVLYLWTEKGADRHCKILDTDKAWEQFDNLEETYFRVKENIPQLSKELQAIFTLDARTVELDKRMSGLENNMTIDHGQAVNIKHAVDIAVKRLCYGSETPAYNNKELKRRIYSYVWRNIKDYFNVTAYHNLLRKDIEIALNYIQNIFLQGSLLREVQTTNNQMSF